MNIRTTKSWIRVMAFVLTNGVCNGFFPNFVRTTRRCSAQSTFLSSSSRLGGNPFRQPYAKFRLMTTTRSTTTDHELTSQKHLDEHQLIREGPELLIHWKGDHKDDYSFQFRHMEFRGALSAVLQQYTTPSDTNTKLLKNGDDVQFTNALQYDGSVDLPELKLTQFNEAMQYLSLSPDSDESGTTILPIDAVLQAASRCSLVHNIYKIIAKGDNYEDLAQIALANGGFDDLMEGGDNEKNTWCFRARVYGELPESEEEREVGKDIRYGGRARSMTAEKESLIALKPLLIKFKGRVNLKEPDCKVYIFDGLIGGKSMLARRLMKGPQTSSMNPNTRICVTNTPLCPIAAYSMCNIAQVDNNQTILDPFAGSCATLIAATMIAPNCQTVGIEIAHDGIVNRDNIRKDFSTRGLKEPLALIEGDSTNMDTIRDEARNAIGNTPFDAIITDPPYGIRESKSSKSIPPLSELFIAMGKDRDEGKPLLKVGGRLVAFVPVTDEETLEECMPNGDLCREAGLELNAVQEQPLNDKLSRWLVSYTCVE